MIKRMIIHPYLMPLYPILFLFNQNTSFITLPQIFRPMFVVLIVALFLTLVFSRIFRNWQKGGIFTSFLLFVFFTYGHLVAGVTYQMGSIELTDFQLVFFPLTGIIVAIYIKLKLFSGDLDRITSLLNLIAVILIAQVFFGLFRQVDSSQKFFQENMAFEISTERTSNNLPDIYFMILDGYARQDVLKNTYDYDNFEFIEQLEERGFYHADKSASVHSQTHLSIASTFNLQHLDFISTTAYGGTTDRRPLAYAVNYSNFVNFLNSLGYQTIVIDTTFPEISEQDTNFTTFIPSGVGLSYFEAALLDTSLASFFFGKDYHQKILSRSKTQDTIDNFSEVLKIRGPKFVYSHLLIPHPPYIFDSLGNDPIEGEKWTYFLQAGYAKHPFTKVKSLYIEQLKYTNKVALSMIDDILLNSGTPPIIILQADHGPYSLGQFVMDNTMDDVVKQRMPILNAVYLPTSSDILYPNISPVNVFRTISDEYLGTNLGLLEDRSYYSHWETPYEFIDASEFLEDGDDQE